MKKEMSEASKLVTELERLSAQANLPEPNMRPSDLVATDQLAVFGKLLVVLARYMDRAQNTIKWLTVVLTAMTTVLVAEVILRFFHHP